MSGAVRTGRIIFVAFLLTATVGYRWMSLQPVRGPSITVQLPPPRPYAPQPAFSFGSNPRSAIAEEHSR